MTTDKQEFSTSRLRELEETNALAEAAPFSLYNTLPAFTKGQIDGYRLYLEDLKPVLLAARHIALPNDHPPTCGSCQNQLEALRKALAALEVQDAD